MVMGLIVASSLLFIYFSIYVFYTAPLNSFPLLMLWMVVPSTSLSLLFSCVITHLQIVATLPNLRRAMGGFCPQCGYNLRGNTSGRCPECGAVTRPQPE